MVLKSALIVNHGADRGAGVSSGRQAGWLHAHRVQPLSASRCVALLHSALALIEGQGQRAFASAAAHVRLRRQVSSS